MNKLPPAETNTVVIAHCSVEENENQQQELLVVVKRI
jgi:hypothetical protein